MIHMNAGGLVGGFALCNVRDSNDATDYKELVSCGYCLEIIRKYEYSKEHGMNTVVVDESRDTDVSVASQGVLGLVKFFDTPWDTNLFPEFLDTLIRTDVDVTPALAARVWDAVTGPAWEQAGKALGLSFLTSEDPTDLARLWESDLRVLEGAR